jgi:hypothetical protein
MVDSVAHTTTIHVSGINLGHTNICICRQSLPQALTSVPTTENSLGPHHYVLEMFALTSSAFLPSGTLVVSTFTSVTVRTKDQSGISTP